MENVSIKKRVVLISVGAVVLLGLMFVLLGIGKEYSRYQKRADARNEIQVERFNVEAKELRGQGRLKEAEWSTKIQTEKARAELEAEKLNAQSEVERAKGAAQAIEIEGGALTDRYIQYLWVRSNNFDAATTIYVPTETNLPILEANRLER